MCKTNPPKVSVVVPVYNSAPFIAETITAVLSQTYENFELILLNDASTDNSAKIIALFDDPRIVKAENKTNLGISATRNKLVQMARGEYIVVLDNDDICLPNRLETQVRFMDEHPEIAMAGSWFELFAPKSSPWWRRMIVNWGWVWCHPLFPTIDDARSGNVLMHPTAIYRRDIFAKHNIKYNPDYTPAEDYDLVRQALAANLKLANIPQILLKYNLHGNNFSFRHKEKMRCADRMVKNDIACAFPQKNIYIPPRYKVILKKLRLKFMIGNKNV